MYLIVAEIFFVGLMALGLYGLRHRLGLMPLFIFVGSNQWVQSWLAITVFADVMGRFPVSPGSAVLFSSSLAIVLLVYIEVDIPTTRRLIYGVVLANVSVIVVAQATKWGLDAGLLSGNSAATSWLSLFNIKAFSIGTLFLLLDSVIILVLYQGLAAKVSRMPQWARMVLSLWLTLLLDSFLFVSVALRNSPRMEEILVGNVIGKSVGAWGFGLMFSFYLARRGTREAQLPEEIYDPFSIFTYRERFQKLRVEKAEAERGREWERERAELAAQAAGLGLWDWHLDSGKVFVDERWANLIGYTSAEFEGTWEAWKALIHPEDLGWVRATQQASYRSSGTLTVEYRMRAKNGDWRWMLCLGNVQERAKDGRPSRVTGTHLDITDQKDAEVTLRRSETQLRRLAARLEAIREEERKAISQEIHDELGQALTGLKMDLAWIDGQLDENLGLSQRVREMMGQVDATVEAVRDLSSRLRPALLDDLGLSEAVEWQVEDFERRSGLRCDLTISVDDPEIAPESAIAVFRILQESLTNVARHAQASRVAVELSRAHRRLVLRVSDDGRGIDATELVDEGTLGLLGMRERAAGIGGTLHIDRAVEGGTQVTVRVPL